MRILHKFWGGGTTFLAKNRKGKKRKWTVVDQILYKERKGKKRVKGFTANQKTKESSQVENFAQKGGGPSEFLSEPSCPQLSEKAQRKRGTVCNISEADQVTNVKEMGFRGR